MTITDSRIKVSFDRDEEKALRIVRDILIKLQVNNASEFINAVTDGDWVYYDESDRKTTTFEFLNNMDREEEEEE